MNVKDTIYEMLLGESLKELQLKDFDVEIEDMFQSGSECDKLYEIVYQANRNICKKLGVEESREIETIITNLDEIQRIIAMKMYDYGYQMAKLGK